MSKKTITPYNLDQYEKEIEDKFNELQSIGNIEEEKKALKEAAKNHATKKKAITIRIREADLEIIRIKASKMGIPYQTYINMLVHKDVTTGS